MKLEKDFLLYFPFLKDKNWEGKISSSQIQKELKPESLKGEKKKLYEVAEEFHSLFVKMMLNSMRKTLNKEQDLLYGGFQQDIYEDMLYDEYTKVFSKNMNSPLVKEIYFQLEKFVDKEENIKRMQENIEDILLQEKSIKVKEWAQ